MNQVFFRLSLAALIWLTGCAITVNSPVNRLDSPETMGRQWRVKLGGAAGGSHSVVLSRTPVDPPDTDSPILDSSTFFRLGAGVAVSDWLDLELRNFQELQAKAQFIGSPRLAAEAGNFSAAATLAGGYGAEKAGRTSPGTDFSKVELSLDSAIIIGYRLLGWVLIYAGPFVRGTSYRGNAAWGEMGQTQSGTFNGSVTSYGGNVGVELGTRVFQARLEWAYGQVRAGTLRLGRSFVGGEIAFQLGKRPRPEAAPAPPVTPPEES